MFSKIAAASLAAQYATGRDIVSKVRDVPLDHPEVDDLHRRPRVMSSDCSADIDRLKAGPVDFSQVIANADADHKYTDPTFGGVDSLARAGERSDDGEFDWTTMAANG